MPSKRRPSLTDIAEEVARIAPADGEETPAEEPTAEAAPRPKTRKRAATSAARVTDNGLRESLEEKDRVIQAQEQTITALRELVNALHAQVDGMKKERDGLQQQIDAATPKKRRRRLPLWKPF